MRYNARTPETFTIRIGQDAATGAHTMPQMNTATSSRYTANAPRRFRVSTPASIRTSFSLLSSERISE